MRLFKLGATEVVRGGARSQPRTRRHRAADAGLLPAARSIAIIHDEATSEKAVPRAARRSERAGSATDFRYRRAGRRPRRARGETMTASTNPADGRDDPLLWLEEIEGERAVAWVEAQNARTDALLRRRPIGRFRRDAGDPQCRRPDSLRRQVRRVICTISGRTPRIRAGCGGAPRSRAIAPTRRTGSCCSTSTR